MLRPKPKMFLALVLLLLTIAVTAQEESTDPYANVLRARAEDGGFVLGDPNAPVKLIEFSDFLCASCQNYEAIISGFVQDYVLTGQARFEYRIFPVIDPELSVLSASLVECADTLRPGQFWPAHDLMFDLVSNRGFTDETIAEFAAALDLDPAPLRDCADDATQHEVDAAYGRRLGVGGTPSLFVQYGDAQPLPIALALLEHYPAIVKAIRPAAAEPVAITHGGHAGLPAFRRADGGFVLGEPDAPLTIVAFEDFLCPHCQTYQSTIQLFIKEYVRSGKASFEYRFYPLVNPQYSTAFAKLAECVGAQDPGLFWDAHDLLFAFAATGNLDDMTERLAGALDLDVEALGDCQDRAIQFLIDINLARKVGVSGTPAIRARDASGELQLIFIGDAPLDRGGASIDQLRALAENNGELTVGPPERSLLNDQFLADASLISGGPCAPPCWQGIRPGETSMDEARAIISEMEGLSLTNIAPDRFQFGHSGAPVCCLIASGDGINVHTILLQFAPVMRFGEVIAALGDPLFYDYDGTPFSESEAMMMFYFPEPSLLISAVVPGLDGALEETSPIIGAVFAMPEFWETALADETLVPWQGYARLAEYVTWKHG